MVGVNEWREDLERLGCSRHPGSLVLEVRVWSCSRWFYRCINVSYVPASELGTRGANGGPEPSGSLTLELTANGKTGIIQESQKQMPS